MDIILEVLTATYARLSNFLSSVSELGNAPVKVWRLLIATLLIWAATKEILREIERVKGIIDRVHYKVHHPYEPSE